MVEPEGIEQEKPEGNCDTYEECWSHWPEPKEGCNCQHPIPADAQTVFYTEP